MLNRSFFTREEHFEQNENGMEEGRKEGYIHIYESLFGQSSTDKHKYV